MLRTEHILYRISQELSLPIEQVALSYGSIVTALHSALAAGHCIECGRLGLLSLHDGRIVMTHTAPHGTDCLGIDSALRDYCAAAGLPLEDTERVREHLLHRVSEALDRRESVTLQDLGIWDPAAGEGEPAFVSAPAIVPAQERSASESETGDTTAEHGGAVDVSRLIAEVHREMGFDPPGDTLIPGAIDVAALIRVVRNNLPDLPEDRDIRAGASRPLGALASDTRPAVAELDRSGADVDVDSGGDFRRNREQLFHPPEQKRGKKKSAAGILATIFLVILLVAVAWFAGLFDAMFSSPPVVGVPRDAAPSAIHQHQPSLFPTEHVS